MQRDAADLSALFQRLHLAACIIQPGGVDLGKTSCRDVKGEVLAARQLEFSDFLMNNTSVKKSDRILCSESRVELTYNN